MAHSHLLVLYLSETWPLTSSGLRRPSGQDECPPGSFPFKKVFKREAEPAGVLPRHGCASKVFGFGVAVIPLQRTQAMMPPIQRASWD